MHFNTTGAHEGIIPINHMLHVLQQRDATPHSTDGLRPTGTTNDCTISMAEKLMNLSLVNT